MPDLGVIVDAAYQAGFRDEDLVTAVAVALAESGGDPKVNNAGTNRNGTVDYGAWQINSVHGPDLDRIYDPHFNAQMAFQIHRQAGDWSPWSAFNNGRYRQFESQAREAVAGSAPKQGVDFGEKVSSGERSGRERAEISLAGLARLIRSQATGGKGLNVDAVAQGQAVGGLPEVDDDPTPVTKVAGQINQVFRRRIEDREAAELIRELQASMPVGGDGDESEAVSSAEWQGIPDVDSSSWEAQGLRPNAARGAAIVRAFGFDGDIYGVGSRGNKSDHPHGRAIDVMTHDNTEYGQQIADYFLENREALGVKYVIFNGRIASSRDGWRWRNYSHPAGRNDPTAMHLDHPHISFK